MNAFLHFPEIDDIFLEQGDDSDNLLTQILELIKGIKKTCNIFYDSQNVKAFLSKIDTIEAMGLKYLSQPKIQLETIIGKTSKSITDKPIRENHFHYITYLLQPFKIDYTNNLLAEAAERFIQFPNEEIIVINIKNTLANDRPFFCIFKDSIVNNQFPEKFIHIPQVSNLSELQLWLSTNQITTFSLLDKNRFVKTKEVQQGQSVYQELSTDYYWYLDNFHKTEYEIFDKNRNHLGIANLEGNIDTNKKVKGRKF